MLKMKTAAIFAIVYALLLCQCGTKARHIAFGTKLNATQDANYKDKNGKPLNFTVFELKSDFGDGHLTFGDIKALGDDAAKIAKDYNAKGNFSTFRMFKELPLERDAANRTKSSALVGTLGAAADIIVTNKDGTVNQEIKVSTMKSGVKHSISPHKHLKAKHSKIHHDSRFKRRRGNRSRLLKSAQPLKDKTVEDRLPQRPFGMEVESLSSHGKSFRPLTVSKMLADFFLNDPLTNSEPFSCGSEKITFIDGKPSVSQYEFSRSIHAQPKRFVSSSLGSRKVRAPCPVHSTFGAMAKDVFGVCTCDDDIISV